MPGAILHEKQRLIVTDKARFKVSVCGRRFGKTWAAREKLSYLSRYKKHLYWYVAPSYTHAKDLLWEDLKSRWDELGWKYEKDEQRLIICRRKTGTIIQLKSGNNLKTLVGKGLNGCIFDEFQDQSIEAWQRIRPALSDKRGWADFMGTPRGFNFFYELFSEAKTRKNWVAFQFKTIDSPFFQTPEGKAELEDARRDLDERTFRQEYEASFETFGGRICYAFDRNIHHFDYDYDPTLPIYVGQDFNRNPMSGVLFQVVAGKSIAFKEMSINTSSTYEICQILKQQYPRATIIFRPDATGARRTSNSSRSDHQIIREHGFTVECKAINPARIDRWAACNRALEKNELLINVKKCPKLTKELETICYKEGTCQEDIKDPLVGHLFDAFGYHVYIEHPVMQKRKIKVYKK